MGLFDFWNKPRVCRPTMLLQQLEERIVLDAAITPTDQHNQENAATNPTDQTDPGGDTSGPDSGVQGNVADAAQSAAQLGHVFNQDLNVVLISNALSDVQAISHAASPDAKVIVYDAQHDTLDSVVAKLSDLVTASGEKIGHLAVLSHGDPGILYFAQSDAFSALTVASHPGAWQTLGGLLAADARIDFYGCDMGKGPDGLNLVDAVACATGATVWTSDDPTGSVSGGDWDLEVKTGESLLPFLIDASALQGSTVFLDNYYVTNPGFETGDLTGWTVVQGPVSVVSGDTDTYGAFTISPNPFASTSNYMVRIDVTSGQPGYDGVPARLSQDFTITSPDDLKFAYDWVTRELPAAIDAFGYRLTDLTTAQQVAYYQINASGIPGFGLRESGWSQVTIPVAAYVGHVLRLEVWAGNTGDTGYPSWGYFDMILDVNNAPVNTVPVSDPINRIHVIEDAQHPFGTDAVEAGDVDIAGGEGNGRVQATLTATNGTLALTGSTADLTGDIDGSDGTLSFSGLIGNVNNALDGLAFTGNPNYNGDAQIVMETSDLGNYPAPASTDSDTIYLTVDPVNDAPSDIALSKSTIAENAGTNAVVGTFTTTDPDAGDTFVYTLVQGEEWFTISGNQLLANASFDYETLPNDYSIRVQVTDHGGLNFGKDFTIYETNVNEAPIAGAGGPYTVEVGGTVTLDGSSSVEPDAPWGDTIVSYTWDVNDDGSFEGSGPLYSFTPAGTAGDTLVISLTVMDQMGATGHTTTTLSLIPPNAPPIAGTFQQSSTEDTVLVIDGWNFTDAENDSAAWVGVTVLPGNGKLFVDRNNNDAYDAGTDTLVSVFDPGNMSTWISWDDALTNQNVMFDPDGNWNGTTSLTYQVRDISGDWGTTATADIMVTPVNDAPVLNNTGTFTLTGITEDDVSLASNPGQTVASIIASLSGDRITDADSGALEGIGIWNTAGNGSWQYSLDGTTWNAVGTVTTSQTLVLRSTDYLRFEPDGMNLANAWVVFKAWDQTDGSTPGAKVSSSDTGGSHAFSNASGTAACTVTAVNDAPVLDNTGNMVFSSIAEDNFTSAGNTVSQILDSASAPDRLTDVDNGSYEGIAVIGVDNTNGTWQFTTNGGGNWTAFGAVSDSSATLLTPNVSTYIRFVPNANWNGTVNEGITFRAWDQTGGYFNGWTGVNITATGGTSPFSTDTETAAITVTAVNDAPTDISLTGDTVAENLPADTVVGTLGATDPDSGDTFTYALISNPDGAFQIVGDQLQTAKPLDHEATPTIDVTVRVTDSGTPELTFDKVFTIAVDDVNETPTDISLAGDIVAENLPADTVVGTLGATDPDAGDTFTYALISNPDGAFKIVGNELQTAKPLDHEATPTIDVTVRVTDSGTPGLTRDEVFTITVDDVNDAPTDISLSGTTVAENQPADTVVGTLGATDQDTGQTFTYSLVNNPDGAFLIVGNELWTAKTLDREATPTIDVTVRVTDSGTPELIFDKVFTIAVDDVNETPTDISLSNTIVAENQPADTVVGTLGVTDPDIGQIYTYSLLSNPDDAFKIVGNELQTAKPLDYEATPTIDVTVRVTDSGTPELTFDEVFTIAVSDANDAPVNTLGTFSVPAGTTQVTLSPNGIHVHDIDPGDVLSVRVQAGTGVTGVGWGPRPTFAPEYVYVGTETVLNPLLEGITANIQPGFYGQANVLVTTTDLAGLSTTGTVIVNVAAGQLPPQVTLGATAYEVYEDGNPVDLGTCVTVSDPNADALTVNLVAPVGSGWSALNATGSGGAVVTGNGTTSLRIAGSMVDVQNTLLTLQGTLSTNFNGNAGINVSVSDGRNAPVNAALTIPVEAVNDAPVATAGIVVSGNEDSAISVTLGMTDPQDAAFAGGPNALQSVNIVTGPAHGTLTQVGPGPGNWSYTPDADWFGTDTFTYTVTDNGGTADGGADTSLAPVTATINVASVNDAPAALPDSATVAPGASVSVTLAMTDPIDAAGPGGSNSLLAVTIVTGPAHGTLTHSGPGPGDWTYTANSSYSGPDSFTFNVRDNGGTANGGVDTSGTPATFTIDVSGEINTPPIATDLTQSHTILEDSGPFNLTDIVVTDPNAGDTITATLTLNQTAAGTLSANDGATYNPATGVWTINGIVSAVNTALANATFTPAANWNGTATVTTHVVDAAGSGPADGLITVGVTTVNDAPVANAGIVVSGNENAAIPVTLGMTDPLDAPFAGGPNALQSVTIVTGPAHGTVTHTGPGAGDWTYTPNLNWTGTDTFTYTVTDNGGTAGGGVDTSASAATVTVQVSSANDAPVNTVPLAVQDVTQGQSLIFTGSNGISVTDADAGTAAIQVDLTATHGTLTLGGRPPATLTITGNGSGTVHIVGNQADINTALNGLTYLPDSWYNGPATIAVGTSDLGHTPPPAMTDSDVVNINVIRVR
ncbi:MAG: tandem-95 repeat protein [Desulfomonile tiedjei]|nr:tandem-95 repeat protein [Desulfomonile tiedjei]